jgi:regulator of nucleoside diphosphate kinase
MTQQATRIRVSRNDNSRLRTLLQSYRGSLGGVTAQYQYALEAELDKAHVMPADSVPDGVVGLGSTVQITDLDTCSTMIFTVVMPEQATGTNRVSVLSPLGMALFGYGRGDTIEWGPVSRLLRCRIDDVRRNGKCRHELVPGKGEAT